MKEILINKDDNYERGDLYIKLKLKLPIYTNGIKKQKRNN